MDATSFLPEKLLSLLFPARRSQLASQIGGELARECRADLWRRICLSAAGMSPAELRGYARAQAGGLVASEADRVLDHHHLQPAMLGRVVAAAIDQVVSMAVRDVLSEPSSAVTRTAA